MDDRGQQLEAFAELARLDVENTLSLRTFLPLWRHVRSLGSNVLIVLGARGSGKTALFKLVRDSRNSPKLRPFLGNHDIPDALWLDAFSQDNRNHPDVGVMEKFGSEAGDIALRAFWVAHLLRVARHEVQGLNPLPEIVQRIVNAPPNELETWVPLAEANLGPIFTALDGIEASLSATKRTVVALYDYLDRIAQFAPDVRRRYVRALLSLWLSLTNRYTHLRGKIFLRDDLFESSEIDFTDANKLRGRSEKLEWEPESLYRVILRQVLNLPSDSHVAAIRRLLEEVPGLRIDDMGEFGLMPAEMSNEICKAFVGRLAGRVIGRGVAKTATHGWILARLHDAHRRITPRALMWMFGYAAEAAKARAPGKIKVLLSASDLLHALRRTSKDRAQEILEEDKLVKRIENLRGKKIPLERVEIVKWLSVRRQDEAPGIPEYGELVLKELLRLGILREEQDGSVDVPDIYRYGFEVGPDYATAWRDLLEGNEAAAHKQFVREPPMMAGIIRNLNVPWDKTGEEELNRGDVAAARARCERALQGAQSTGDPLLEADALTRLAEIDGNYKSDYVRAKLSYQKAILLAQRAHDYAREANIRWLLAMTHSELSETEDALANFESSLRLAKQDSNFQLTAFGYWGVAFSSVRSGRNFNAVSLYVRGLVVAQRHEIADAEHSIWHGLGDLAALLHNYDAANQMFALGQAPPDRYYDSPNLEKLRQEALAEYERDKGHSLLKSAFPDVDIDSLLQE